MILSITLNPSIDYILQVEKLALEETQRAKNIFFYASGKGVNVSRMLDRFGVQTSSWGFIGGLAGDRFIRVIENEGINTSFTPCQGETRINVIVTELQTYGQLRISAKGPDISEHELDKLIGRIKSLPEEVEYIALGGSLPGKIPDNIYKDLIEIIQSQGVKCILDTSGEPLIQGIKAKPHLIKPNLHELSQITEGRKLDTDENIIKAAKEIVDRGVKNVVVSLASKGAFWVTQDKVIQASAPKVNAKSKVGAGDSMVAGLVYALHKLMSEEKALKYGIAFGTAAVLTTGTELAYKEDVEKLLSEIKISVSA